MAYAGEEATGYLVHAFATNLRFEDDEFNFVKARAKVGTSDTFRSATGTSGSTACGEPGGSVGADGGVGRSEPRGPACPRSRTSPVTSL